MFRRRPTLKLRRAVDRDAFARDVLVWLQPLYGAALRLTRNRPDAEDLVQNTVVKALRAADRFTPGTNLKAWLFTILHNTWRNDRRTAARSAVDVDTDRLETAAERLSALAVADTPEAILLRSALDADLQTALDAMPEALRQAVWLRDVEEFSYAEIAEMLGLPMGTVMSRISRGRRQLFARLTEQSTVDSRQSTVVGSS